jgi:hypothetical protein
LKTTPANGFDELEQFLSSKRKLVFRASCFITLVFSLLLFNVRVSEGGDDSAYIFVGWKYAQDIFHYSYSYNAPLYPLLLSLPIKIIGLNIILLKLISTALYFFSFLFFFRAFEKRVPYLVLLPALIFYAINAKLQYYSGETYNEAFFLFFQSLFLFYFFKLLDRVKEGSANWKSWLVCGLLITSLSLIKNLGIAVFPIVIFFFLFQKQWRNAGYIFITSVGSRSLYEFFARLGGGASQFSAQSEMLFKKTSYGAEGGNEDLFGMASRFVGNCNLYFSRRIPQVLGFQNESVIVNYSHAMTVMIAVSVALLLIAAFFTAVRSGNKVILFACLFTGGLIAASFIVLQVSWGQARFIVIHMPVLVLMVMFAMWTWLKRFGKGRWTYLFTVIVLSGSWLISSSQKIAENIPVMMKQLQGDKYAGFTPDWQHFLKMSRWCSGNLPPDAVVASRKAGMSFIYSNGKEFFPVNRVLFEDERTGQSDADKLLAYFKANNVRYVIVPSLRYNPEKKDGAIVNTMTLLLMQVVNKYPDRTKFIHREGEEDDEPSYLYELIL